MATRLTLRLIHSACSLQLLRRIDSMEMENWI